MPKVHTVTLRSRWLGTLLRQLREQNKKTLAEAAEYLQRDSGMLSRYENATSPIRRGDVLALIDLYGVSDEHTRTKLIKLAEEIWRKGWWEGYTNLSDEFLDFTWLESLAERICLYDAMYVPGLLQTRAYAESIIGGTEPADTPPSTIQNWVDFRLERQQVFTADENKRLTAIVEESVLHRPVGGVEVLRGQLKHLLSEAGQPSVELMVLPTAAGAHPGLDGPFRVFEMSDPYPDVAYVETLGGRIVVESPAVDKYLATYDRLREMSLGPERSMALISTILEDLGEQRDRARAHARASGVGMAH